MAKGKDPNEEFYQFISQMKDMVENMSEKERGEFKKVMMSEAGLAELENEKFYTYQRPDYASKAAKEIDWQWLAPFWHVEPGDAAIALKYDADGICRTHHAQFWMAGCAREI
jgi:hypothetical protein